MMKNTPILFPSGEDANPLHKRLPAEVVTRKPRQQPRVVEEKIVEDVRVDLKSAVILKPDARPKWLQKACKMAEENRASTTELYNIVTSRKFVSGLPPKIGRRLRDITLENMELFSDKQRRYLKSEEWILNGLFVERTGEDGDLDILAKDSIVDELLGSEQESFKKESERRDVERREGDRREPERKDSDKRESEKKADRKEVKREEERPRPRRPERMEEPQSEQWVTVASGRGQEDRVSKEQALAEERARRKAKEREEREKWMQAHFEASQKQAQEQHEEAKKRQQEDAVDSSLMLLDEIASAPVAVAAAQRDSERSRRGRGGLSRSRSVRVRSRSRRRDGRRRRSRESPPKVDFADALRRRLEEREANDTVRAPVVDPGHAARWAQYDRK